MTDEEDAEKPPQQGTARTRQKDQKDRPRVVRAKTKAIPINAPVAENVFSVGRRKLPD
jgi:hypothetical protein